MPTTYLATATNYSTKLSRSLCEPFQKAKAEKLELVLGFLGLPINQLSREIRIMGNFMIFL
jgi:hypothetical protein